MLKMMNKKMVAAMVLGLALNFGAAYQAPVVMAAPAETQVSVNVQVII